MNIEDIKKRIKDSDYNFLREDKRLCDNIILLTLGGSHAYGTNINIDGHISDIDIRGIRLNTREEILTMKCDDKPYENHELDVVIYPLKQIIQLLTNCNPNTIEILGTKKEHILHITEEGKILRDNVDVFLSQVAYHSFGGYALSQLRRLENALARDNYPQDKKEEHIKGAIERAMLSFNNKYKDLGNGFNIYIDKSNKADFDKEIFMNLNLKGYPLRDFHGVYSEMSNIINDYSKLNHRNKKKDELHLLKHSMHLIRLLITGTEVLSGKGINTYREKDKEFLLDIRNGKYSYEEIFEMVSKYEKEFEYANKNTILPQKPNHKKINEIVIEINKKVLSR